LVLFTPSELRAEGLTTSEKASLESAPQSEQSKIVVGSDVPKFSDLAAQVGKGMMWMGALLFIGVMLLKKYGPQTKASQSLIEVLARQNLAPRMQLSIIRVEGRKYLISTTSSEVRLLTELVQPYDAAELDRLLAGQEIAALRGNG
jgi:flagellar biogenesis protein FliO